MAKRKIKVFIDANIFVAGAGSLNGGSAFILHACKKEKLQGITTELILHEAKRNIREKLSHTALERFYKWSEIPSLLIQPLAITTEYYQKIITPKDAHVLAAAIESESDYLLTLDREHFFTAEIRKADLPIKIVTPKEFLQNEIPDDLLEDIR